jgi:Domain of unknown function (DUF4271)
MACWVTAQTANNPFDLKFRPAKKIEVAKPAQPVPDSINKEPVPDTPKIQEPIKSSYEDTSILHLGKTRPDTPLQPSTGNPFEKKNHKDSAASVVFPVEPKDTAAVNVPSLVPPSLIKHSSKGIQIFFLLLSLLFLIFIVNVERNYVRDLWRVISNENYSSLYQRNQRSTIRQILLFMGYSIFIFQSGIFIFNALRIFHYQGPVRLSIWILMILVLGVYFTRHTVIRYLRWLFNNRKELTLFGFDISIFNTMVGLVLLPINILLVFGPDSFSKPLIIIGIIAFLVAYLMRQLRWMFTSRGLIARSLFLFFIYLCAVEILPIWALSKFFW